MNRIAIRWYYGYVAYVNGIMHTLKDATIHFYDKDGDIVKCALDNTIQFNIDTLCEVKEIRPNVKLNFESERIYMVRHKANAYAFYIPKNVVGLKEISPKKELMYQEMEVFHKKRYLIDVEDINYFNPYNSCKTFYKLNNKLCFERFVKSESTKKGKMVDELVKEISEICHVSITTFNMCKILEKYKIEKK